MGSSYRWPDWKSAGTRRVCSMVARGQFGAGETIGGTAVRRDAYQKVGGFKSGFGCFAKILLELPSWMRADTGPATRSGRSGQALSTSLHEVLADIREYRAGDVADQSQCSNEQFEAYFGWLQTWDARGCRRQKAGARVRGLQPIPCDRSSVARRGRRPWHARATSGSSPTALGMRFRRRAELSKAAAAYAWERVRFAWTGHDGEERYRRFLAGPGKPRGWLARQQALLRRKPRAERQDRAAPLTAPGDRPGTGPS